jgi:hypothetical protein
MKSHGADLKYKTFLNTFLRTVEASFPTNTKIGKHSSYAINLWNATIA